MLDKSSRKEHNQAMNQLPSHDEMVLRILAKYNASTKSDRANGVWYETANTFVIGLANKHGVSVETAVSVVAILSPRLEWGLNQRYADQYLATGNAPTFFSTLAKLARITGGESLANVQKGRKVAAFADNILNPLTSTKVTVDRHAVDIATGSTDDDSRKALDRKGAYDAVEAAYVGAACKVGIAPCELQAIVWVAHKRTKAYGPKHQQFSRKGAVA